MLERFPEKFVMPTRSLLTVSLLLMPFAGHGSGSSENAVQTGADLILVNARVYTLDWQAPAPDGTPSDGAPRADGAWQPDAEAVVIDDGTIVFVGASDDASGYRGVDSRVIDVGGATVLPGLIDSHTHVFELGRAIDEVSLVGVDSEAEAVELIAARAATVPKGEWILGGGWDEGAWADRYPDKALLSEAVPDHPVLMRGLHGFADWCNQAALDAVGITAESPVPTGGEMPLDENGEPAGLFINRAVQMPRSGVPEPSDTDLARQVLLGLDRMAEDGYVMIHDAGLGSREMAVLERLEADGRLPIRVYAMLSLRDEPLMRDWIARGPDTDNDSRLVTRTVKAYYDGALGSRGARLLYDYSDRPGHRGVSGADYGFNEELMEQAIRAGFQVAVHAIGDAGNREALDILERIMNELPVQRALRHRIEHAQVVHPDDVPRLAELGIIASMEPPHAVEDRTWAEDRLGPERIRHAYAWRTLRENGAVLTFNADNPGSDHDIFYGLHAAVTRRDKNLQPEGGWYPEEAVTIEEALRAYTEWAAYASFREDETGVIRVGNWADLTVLDIDPFITATERPGELLDGRVLMTVVDGAVVHEQSR
jgi:predicted amidohydrolase YtcJ